MTMLLMSCSELSYKNKRTVASEVNKVVCQEYGERETLVNSELVVIEFLDENNLELTHISKDSSSRAETLHKDHCRGAEVGTESTLKGECYANNEIDSRLSISKIHGKIHASYHKDANKTTDVRNIKSFNCKGEI